MKTIPDAVGKDQKDTRKAPTDVDLALDATTDAYSEDVPQGQVISQSQASGSRLAHDSVVDVVLLRDREPPTVLSLNGMNADTAKGSIKGLGLMAVPTETSSDTVAKDQVIFQQANEGMVLHHGDTVAYTVSKGSEKVTVPNVVGRRRQDAHTVLEAANFIVQEEAIPGGFLGTVRQTDPAAGTVLKRGSVVTITIV